MKKFAAVLLLAVCAAAGAARWLDVVNYTDLSTGFVTYGPYWVRYAVAGGVLALLALGALLAPRRPASLGGQSVAQGLFCFAAGVGFAAAAGAKLAGWAGLAGIGRAQAVLYLVSGAWMLLLGRSRFTAEFEAPSRSALFGVAGSLSLFLLTVSRFGLAPTGLARVDETFSALAALAALLFCAAQARAAYAPGSRGGGWVFFTGSAAFLFCVCLALPGAAAKYMVGAADAAALLEAACLALTGLCGAVYALGAVGRPAPEGDPQAAPGPAENVMNM